METIKKLIWLTMSKVYVHKMLSIALKTSSQRNPNLYPRGICILVDVDANESNQLEERLHEAKDKYMDECIFIIPYDSGNFHWIGLIIEFNDDQQIQRAEYIDPVNESNYSPVKLQDQFNKVFSDCILQTRTASYKGHQSESASLIVKNLLEAISESKCKQIEHSNTKNLSEQVNDTKVFSSNTFNFFHLQSLFKSDRENTCDESALIFSVKENEVSKSETKPCSTLSRDILNPDSNDFQITTESLKDTYKDFYSMPSCAERFLLSLCYLISLKLVAEDVILDYTTEPSNDRKLEIDEELQCLKERLKFEEISSTKIQHAVAALSIHIKNENWKSSLTILNEILHEIMPLNIYELRRLVKSVDDAANVIKDKKIIFFLGNTGSGKSTTIHFLAGSKMIRTNIKGLNHIAPTEIKNSDLKLIVTAPFAKSVTRCITPVTVSFKDIGAYGHDSIILCDSPGFDDTNGAENDIANGIAIVRVIHACESVKPVVVVSCKGIGDRYARLKDLIRTLARLIPNIKSQIKAFSYIFTKYPEDEKNTIHASLKTVNNTLSDQERSDASFMNILRDMIDKTKENAYFLDPIKDEPGTILDQLADSIAIDHPENVFQFFITENSKTILNKQVTKYELNIQLATKRSEYLLVKHILDQSKFLNDLLNQDFIKQIYLRCTEYVSRHLSEEYQKATLILDRCLLEEKILIDEEIKQYRTFVDYAKLAEDLRKTHLGNEAIQSCAYIEYVNEKVEKLVKILQEKDIHDLSIKLSIDKIKILSEYFDDVNVKYKLICQIFSQKIEELVVSFEKSVMSNEFYDSISIMTKMYDANTSLANHSDIFNFEKKYSKMKEFFLNYLNNYVQEFHAIFFKDQLEPIDMENLNNCVCTLEQLMNIFNLDLHISKVELNKIYEDFSHKLVNYFEHIIEKINNELENQHTFNRLEHFFEDLDSLRTISIITHKTNQIYYITVGKLVDHMNQTRIYIDELLTSLFRREDEFIYEKITSCLLNLKNAQWIEKYRARAYLDLIKHVEQQLVQHIKELEKSLIKSNLDLDDSTKIFDASKILIKMDEMRCFESFIPNIKQYLDEVNSKFKGIINNVFIIIKDTFNLDKKDEQVYKTFDYYTAEKALLYLDVCKTIHIVKNDSKLILTNVKDYIRHYISFIKDEINGYFNIIKQCQHGNENDMLTKIEVISNRLQDLVEIKTTCNRIFSSFDKPIETIIKNWQNYLSNYLSELSGEMNMFYSTQNFESLDNKLSIIKILSNLDWFVKDEKYTHIYRKYREKRLLQIYDIDKEIVDAIENFNYELIDEKMKTLQSQNKVDRHFYEKAKRSLEIGLNRLKEDTKGITLVLTYDIKLEQIQLIIDNLKRLENAKSVIEKHSDIPHTIDEFIEEIKKLIEIKMKHFLGRIKALIRNYNFFEADEKIDAIILVRNLLGKYCLKHISDQIETVQNYGKTVVLPEIINRYSQMDITEYILNPPKKVLEKLDSVNSTNQIYSEVSDKLKKIILEKFRNELARAKTEQTVDITNEYIRRFESALIYLPESMKKALEFELQICKGLKLQDSLDETDNCSSEYENLQVIKSYFSKGQELASERIENIVFKIHQNLEKQNIMKVLNDMKLLHMYKTELNTYINHIETVYVEIHVEIICMFEDIYQYFVGQILTHHQTKRDKNEVSEKKFICLFEFMIFRDDPQNEQISNFILPENFDEKMIRLFEKIREYSKKQEKNYKVALENFDIPKLVNILETMYTFHSLLRKIKVYHNQNIDKNSLINSMIENLEKLTPHSYMLESICEKIEDLWGELIDTNRKHHMSDRDDFYRNLNEKFSILIQTKTFRPFHLRTDVDKLEQKFLKSFEKKVSVIYSYIEKFLNNFSEERRLSRRDYENFNRNYFELISIERTIKTIHFQRKLSTETIKNKLYEKIKMWESSIEHESTLENVADNLIKMKVVSMNISCLKNDIEQRVEEILSNVRAVFDEVDFATLIVIINEAQDL
jgi:DNA polymerase III delta prime subunit